MHDAPLVQLPDRTKQLRSEETQRIAVAVFLWVLHFDGLELIGGKLFHEEVDAFGVLEGFDQLDHVGVFELPEDVFLVDQIWVVVVFVDDFLGDYLQGLGYSRLVVGDQLHLAEGPRAQLLDYHEV